MAEKNDQQKTCAQLDEHRKQKRRRLNPTHRWTDAEVVEMLNIIVEAIKEKIESFEKPTVESFYNKVCAQSPHLQPINWLTMKGKMRHLKVSYINAANWKNKTGAGLLANGEEKTVSEYINEICPHWNLLRDIFGQRKCVDPSFIYESTSAAADESLEEINFSNLIEVMHDDCDVSEIITSTPEKSFVESEIEDESDLVDEAITPQKSRKGFGNVNNKLQRKSSSPFDLLLKMQERRLDLETKKIDMEAAKNNLQQQLLSKKLEIEKEERIAALKLEKETELKKYELELKLKNNQL